MEFFAGEFRVLTAGGSYTVPDLREMASAARRSIPQRGVWAVDSSDVLGVLSAVVGLDGYCREVQLVPEGVTPATGGLSAEGGSSDTRWIVYSSGTTGAPKPIVHTLRSLSRAVRPQDGPRTWGLVYDPRRLAGLAVIVQALATGSVLVDATRGSIAERVSVMRDAGVDALSATPTLWRQILQTSTSDGWNLKRITVGGEIADQLLLDALASAFRDAHVTHVFAATETGVAFSVGDGRAGFPASYLENPPRGVALKIRDGILWVHSPTSGLAGEDGFVSTGDVVEVRGDRVLFAGRASGVVNVGGTKVHPENVESLIREHPDVREVVVTARPNPFSGNVLIATVVLRAAAAANGTESSSLRQWLSQRAPAPMVPAQFHIVESLASSTTGKVVRS